VPSPKRRRRTPTHGRTLPEELFGVAWARRLRIAIPAAAAVLLVAGCVTFAIWSQTLGSIALALGLGLGLIWFFLRQGDPDGAVSTLRRARPQLIAIGGALVAAGGAVYAVVDQDLGLLLVLLGGATLAVNLLGLKQEPLASPMDGPIYGDTPPYGE
jgi:hypothetical protein